MDSVVHVKIPTEYYERLRVLAKNCEGSINQQVRLAIRRHLESEHDFPAAAGVDLPPSP